MASSQTLPQGASGSSWSGFCFVFFFLILNRPTFASEHLALDDEVFLFVTIWVGVWRGGGYKINLGYFGKQGWGEGHPGAESGSWALGTGRPLDVSP